MFEIYSCEFLHLDTWFSLCQIRSGIAFEFCSLLFFVIGGPEVELSKNAYKLKISKFSSFKSFRILFYMGTPTLVKTKKLQTKIVISKLFGRRNLFRGFIEYLLLYSLSPYMSHAPPIFGLIVDMTYLMSAMMCQ